MLAFCPQSNSLVVTRWFLLFPELFSHNGVPNRKEARGEKAFLSGVALFYCFNCCFHSRIEALQLTFPFISLARTELHVKP